MPGPVRFNKKGKVVAGRDKGGGRVIRTRGAGKSTTVTPIRSSGSSGGSRRSSGGRTRAERSLQRNLRINRKRAKKAKVNPLATKPAREAIDRLREKYSVSMAGNRREQALENTAVRSAGLERARKFTEQGNKARTGGAAKAERAVQRVREGTDLNTDGRTAKTFRGLRVVGTIPAENVREAAEQGQLRRAKRKQVTTPEVRRVQKKVKRTAKRVARLRRKAGGRIDGPLTQGQKKFVQEFSKRTGINPRVAGAWVLAEMSGGAASGREAEGNHNWLNIAYFDSGPGSITQDAVWSDPTSAAKASAQFLRGKRFGASQGIRNILPQARGRSDEAQIQAIAGSGWASSGYEGGNSLRGTRDLVSVRPANPKVTAKLKKATGKLQRLDEKAAELGLPTRRERQSGGVSWGPKKARKRGGAWAGTQGILERAGRGFTISSRKRAASDPLSQSNPGSDHNTANPDAYAHDIPAVGDENGIPIAEAYHKRLGLNEPLAIGTYNNYTSRKYPGYRFQILWNVSGHYDHVHVGAKWTGEDLPAGTYYGGSGGTYSSGGSGGTEIAAGGGGSAPAASGGGGGAKRKNRRETALDRLAELGFRVTPEGIKRTGVAGGPAPSGKSSGSQGETLTALKRKYKV